MDLHLPTLVTLDFETHYSSKEKYSLKYMTTEAYVRDPRFQVIGVGVAVGMDPPTWMSSQTFHAWGGRADWSKVRCLAHHAHFDGLILNHHFGIRPGFWLDTLSMARELHGVEVGGSLAKLAEHYKAGRKGDAVIAADGKWLVDFTGEEWDAYGVYCCNDVALTREICLAMWGDLPASSIHGINMMVRMFTEPSLLVNEPFLAAYRDQDRAHKQALLDAVVSMETGLAPNAEETRISVMSNDRFARMLTRLGVDPPTKKSAAKTKRARALAAAAGQPDPGHVETWALAKTDPGFQALLDYEGENAEVVQALANARLAVKSTINETRADRLLAAGRGGRPVPVYLKWYAAHTGRAGGGDRMNFQNLERVDPTGKDPQKGSLRKSLCAPPGHKLIVVDSSQIEARVLAWISGAFDTLDTFRRMDQTGGDFYAERGQLFFGFPLSQKETPRERGVAKGLELGLGFYMGWKRCAIELLKGLMGTKPVQFTMADAGRFQVDVAGFEDRHGAEAAGVLSRLGPRDFIIHAAVTEHFVARWREVNPAVVRFWRSMGRLLREMAELPDGNGGPAFGPARCLLVERHKVRLPDGSYIRYPGLRGDMDTEGKVTYSYRGRGNARLYIHSGLFTENMVQGMARCIVFDQALRIQGRLRQLGGHVVMTVHDEVVSMAPGEHARAALAAALEDMRTLPAWCEGLPLAATGGLGQNYGECK